jgi:hypothetical protein
MTPAEAAEEMRRLSRLLDSGLQALRDQAKEYAEAEDAYRMARATAYLTSTGTVDERKAHADLATSEERRRAHLADGMRSAATEAVRSRRGQISALQSLLNAHRAEAEFARTTNGEHA